MGVGRGFFQFIRRADTCYSWPLFSSYPRKLSSLDKFTASSKLAPTLGKAQIAVSGCRIAGQFRQMLALGGSVLAMLDSETRSPQYGWPPSQGLPVYVELPNRESIDLWCRAAKRAAPTLRRPDEQALTAGCEAA